MANNNIKILTDKQLEQFKSKYSFDIEDNQIVVSYSTSKKKTRHDIGKPFSILSREIGRKLTFTQSAIDLWITFKNEKKKFSLIDVQQALNILKLTYRTQNRDNVLQVLKSSETRIKIKR